MSAVYAIKPKALKMSDTGKAITSMPRIPAISTISLLPIVVHLNPVGRRREAEALRGHILYRNATSGRYSGHTLGRVG